MKDIDYEILQDIITDHNLCSVQKEELSKVIEKLIYIKMDSEIANVDANLRAKDIRMKKYVPNVVK